MSSIFQTIEKKYFISSAVFLMAACVLYVLFREITLFDPQHELFPLFRTQGYEWIKFNAPDFLWMLSLISFIQGVWSRESRRSSLIWQLCAVVLAFFLELGQAKGVVPGTFDSLDLISYLIAWIFFIPIQYYLSKHFTNSNLK